VKKQSESGLREDDSTNPDPRSWSKSLSLESYPRVSWYLFSPQYNMRAGTRL
jgi:hypothetical protein